MTFRLIEADCIEAMADMEPASVDAIVTDPPYGLEFMGKEWDSFKDSRGRGVGAGIASMDFKDFGPMPSFGKRWVNKRCRLCGHIQSGGSPCQCDLPEWEYEVEQGTPKTLRAYQAWCEAWATQALRILKPGGHLLAFGGTRTYHRLACALEDAGFEIRDTLCWLYAQGFPKSLNLKGCQCQEGEYRGGREAVSEHDLRSLRGSDLPPTVDAANQREEVLLSRMPEQGVPARGTTRAKPQTPGREQSSLEGGRDAQTPEGELQGRPLRESAGVAAPDGSQGRLHHGAPASDGADVRAAADSDGGREPHRPQPLEQRSGEPGTLADERRPQARGGWPLCPRCGEPRLRGLGTALKPAFEPVVLARKPLAGTVAANVLEHGTGALNIDGTRIEGEVPLRDGDGGPEGIFGMGSRSPAGVGYGRWPANVILDEEAAAMLDEQSGETSVTGIRRRELSDGASGLFPVRRGVEHPNDPGGASRFFYTSKADRAERERGVREYGEGERARGPVMNERCVNCGRGRLDGRRDGPCCEAPDYEAAAPRGNVGNHHPTVKPVELMQWLCRLVTPPGGLILDPFTGSGSTGIAACREGFEFIGIEREHDYVEIARARIIGDGPLFNEEAEPLNMEEK